MLHHSDLHFVHMSAQPSVAGPLSFDAGTTLVLCSGAQRQHRHGVDSLTGSSGFCWSNPTKNCCAQVFAFGCNSAGQLGLGDFQDRRAPCEVSGLWALPVVALSAGDEHSTALTVNGFLFSWGANDRGQLGLPKNADAAERVRSTDSSVTKLCCTNRLEIQSCNEKEQMVDWTCMHGVPMQHGMQQRAP